MNTGASNRPMYDQCNYQKRVFESTSPLGYVMYHGKFENCNKFSCNDTPIRTPMELVDVESELRNITRPLSECDQHKYNPNCKRSATCWPTKEMPVVSAPEVCPIIHNNIPRVTNNGLPAMPTGNAASVSFCKRK